MCDRQKAQKQQVLVYWSVFHCNKFHPHFITYFLTHISAMPGTEAASLFEPSKCNRCPFFFWLSEHKVCEFIAHLQLRQHPKSETQPCVYCTGQFRWWFLFTVQSSETPQSRDLLWKVATGWSYQWTAIWGVCCERKMNILMDGLKLLFALPQAAVTWNKADQIAKDLFHWPEDAKEKFILTKTY